ncbi:MAG: Alanine racemase [Candidatus Ozemobacter sibiricus]|uniref:Alanine racemase n=1 Tax=Candidatus Ozemobacter sibiricus TaxID=2268124 RepID=A0A367ZJN8_9BACT|nr:MAG: Alanine racemase [Candidatus Ozemobacter sibiricus]
MPMLYQTHARIHLQNIRFNIEGIREAVGPGRKILIAVKANAYGHGAVEVSRMAERIGVDWLGVATVPEGIQLREAGIRLPILKFSPAFPEEMEAALRHDLALTVCDPANIKALDEVAAALNKRVPVHLKVDTGMGRIGVTPEAAPDLAYDIEKHRPHLFLEGVFTHLPVSDELNKMFTQRQLALFRKTVETIESRIGRQILLVHAANSGGVLAHPESWLSMVRPGIMIYGFYPSHETPQTIPLRPGLSFLTRVSFLKKVTAGTSIGYGRTWIAPEDTWIATFPAGYADGFNRLFSNRGRVLIGGRSYPVVGRVCMDQTMCNLGPETNVQVGDEVVLIGTSGDETISVYEWAGVLNTITYEVTCQINVRVPRVYDPY